MSDQTTTTRPTISPELHAVLDMVRATGKSAHPRPGHGTSDVVECVAILFGVSPVALQRQVHELADWQRDQNAPEWVVEIVDNVTTHDGHEIGRVNAETHADATERAGRMVPIGATFRVRSPEIASKTNNVWELGETYAMRVGERHEWVHEPATVLVDLVADLMHLADLRGVSAEAVLADAHDHYAADLRDYAETHPGDVPFA